MCGIAGIIDNALTEEAATVLLEKMLAVTRHRGPDHSGIWKDVPLLLGHNRLSIIDLSDSASQPMDYDDAVITYNGEIYNYIEIRSELESMGHRFRTKSDTEVILAAYSAWGSECVQKFIGMWAFAIWDKRNRKMFCSRDRFGIKPFYYIIKEDKFYFASEVKALKLTPVFSSDLNIQQVYRGLQLGWITWGEESYFECVRQLPAASNLMFEKGTIQVKKYWDIRCNSEKNTPSVAEIREHREKFRALFLDAVKIHMRSDVTVGGCLSGGIDSSAIASSAAKLHPDNRFKTFTIYYEGPGDVDERPWAKEVISKYKNIEPYYYSPSDAEIAECFDKVLFHQDAPVASSSPLSQYFLMKLAKEQGVKVVLDGQGADEYLGGYIHIYDRLLADRMKNFDLLTIFKILSSLKQGQLFSKSKIFYIAAKSLFAAAASEQGIHEQAYRRLFPFLPADTNSVPFRLDTISKNNLDNFLYHLAFNISLPTLLHYEDRNSMAFSIESRVPFLDHRLVEFAFSLSGEERINAHETKSILRNALPGILPDAIALRKDKKGFVTPGEEKWLRGPLKHLLDIDFSKLPFLDTNLAKKMVSDYQKGNSKNALLVWRLAALNRWLTIP